VFTEEKQITLQVLPNKLVKVTIITTYLKNGSQIGQDTWQQIVEPNNASIENAKTFLDDYYMDIIYSVFTDEVVEQYRLEHENNEVVQAR
jgi:hypothetical protein